MPTGDNSAGGQNPIDAFVAARLSRAGLQPLGEAPRQELIRRLTLDLTGLLPEPDRVERFVADNAPDAYERLVDELLGSPQLGERWARHWLDLARYAESEGFKSDETRPNAWRYRDYVIRAFNEDRPYKRFLQEQIAGDELWPGDPEARVATAFNRHYPDESNARDLFQRRQEILNDITDTSLQVITGLTFGCARCHDHKFDPITQADYYRLQAFFANVRAMDDVPMLAGAELKTYRERRARWEEQTAPIRARMSALEEPRRQAIARDNLEKFPPEIQAAILKPAAERTPLEWQMHYKALPYMNPDRDAVLGSMKPEDRKQWDALSAELAQFSGLSPGELPLGTGIVDAGPEAPPTHVLGGGALASPGREVHPGFPEVFAQGPPRIVPPEGLDSTGRRTALAAWLTAPDHPLVARALVNRLWHHHFGRGLAGTPNDLGALGDPPTHPELLDWLAVELVEGEWSLKRIHRLMVTSAAYRRASRCLTAPEADPDNKLLWRFPRLRLEGESIRDTALQAADLLNLATGGPSVLPELPEGVGAGGYTRWNVSKDSAARQRRSIYVFVKRNLRYPLFEAFDMPDTHESCGRRNVTTTAPQALLLLNDHLVLGWARAFADRCRRGAGDEPARQVELAFRILYSRAPTAEELAESVRFLAEQSREPGGSPAALADLCHALLNSSEAIYRS